MIKPVDPNHLHIMLNSIHFCLPHPLMTHQEDLKNNELRNSGMNRNLEINMTDTKYDPQIYYDVHNHNINTSYLDLNDNKFALLNIIRSNIQSQKKFPCNGPKMAKERWKSLSTQEQQIWDTLSNQSKTIILGISPPK